MNLEMDKAPLEKENDIAAGNQETGVPKEPQAGLFRRGFAFLIDHLILFVTFLFVFNYYFDFFLYKIIFSPWQFSLYTTIAIFTFELYFILFEWFWKGKTPGKFLLSIYAAREDGRELDFYSVLVRNLLRCTYFIPPFFILPDVVSLLLTKRRRRLGDLIAGTVCLARGRAKSDAPF
ncbi:MAG TPA: RDD family protein [Ignavibacteriales bacterium]|nr:RDD family protein [Ignavibacteriales bacterium]